MYNYNDIRVVHLEITQKCQASCPMCDRNQNGGAINPHISLAELSLESCKQIFEPVFIKQLDYMYMCGNLGDPIIASDTLEVFEYFRKNNPNMKLSMNTNAGARNQQWWHDLAKILGRRGMVRFSIDGLEDTNHLYRRGVQWDNVMSSLSSFIEAGGNATWDYLVFDHNAHQVEEARKLSKQLGVTTFVEKKTSRFYSTAKTSLKDTHTVKDRKGNDQYELKPVETPLNKKINNTIDKHGSLSNYYDTTEILCKVKEQKNIYITAEGLAMPCCWTASRMYKWWHKDPKVEQVWQFIKEVDRISVLKHGIKGVLDSGVFQDIEASWNLPSVAEGKLKVCSEKCGKEFDPFKEQFVNAK